MFIIESQSGVSSLRNCLLGHGPTESEAWEDAFGPAPYTDYERRAMARAWCREIPDEEADELIYG